MMATSLVFVPVVLDCGCTVTPRVLNGMEPHTSGGALVHCPDHAIRQAVNVASVVVTITYEAKRIDPADPEQPEPEALAGAEVVLHAEAKSHGLRQCPSCRVWIRRETWEDHQC